MRSNIFTALRFIAALITIGVILIQPKIPPYVMVVHPQSATRAVLHGPEDGNGQNIARWLDPYVSYWRCNYEVAYASKSSCSFMVEWLPGFEHVTNCSFSGSKNPKNCVSLKPDVDFRLMNMPECTVVSNDNQNTLGRENGRPCRIPEASTIGIDLSRYDAIRVNIHYEGRARHLRLFMRNLDPNRANDESAGENSKFMEVFLRTDDLKAGAETIRLDEFNVAEWWVLSQNVTREDAQPAFNNIVAIGVDHVDHGIHKMKVNRIELVGERLSMATLLMGVLGFWVMLLLLEYWARYRHMEKTSRERAMQISELATSAVSLTMETSELQSRNLRDPLTGVLNRNGLAGAVKPLFDDPDESEIGLLLIDIDQFKSLNEKYGHTTGDRVLRTFVNLVAMNIREDDIFARWGGNEFIVVCPRASRSIVLGLGEKLRTVVAAYVFDLQPDARVTVSIGGTSASKQEGFTSIFKRIDTALGRAKHKRNTFEYE